MSIDTVIRKVRTQLGNTFSIARSGVYPVATPEKIQRAEANLGFPLPPLLRELYLQVGNGGFGPQQCSLLGVEGGYSHYGDTIDQFYLHDRQYNPDFPLRFRYKGTLHDVWPSHLLCAFLWPCTIFSCLDCSEENVPVYVFDTNFINGYHLTRPIPLYKHIDSFVEWLEAGVEGVDLFAQMSKLAHKAAREMMAAGFYPQTAPPSPTAALQTEGLKREEVFRVPWSPKALFHELLIDFGAFDRTSMPAISTASLDKEIRIAKLGFARFVSLDHWTMEHHNFMQRLLQGDYSMEELSWFEEDAEAIRMFACLAYGAMLGKFWIGEIDDSGFSRGETLLPSFMLAERNQIHVLYQK